MQTVIRRIRPTSLEQYVYMGDGIKVQVDFLGVVRLQIITINFLELQDVAFIPFIRKKFNICTYFG